MNKLFTFMILVGLLAGCASEDMATARKNARANWSTTRAEIAFGVASDLMKTGQLQDAQAKCQEALQLDGSFIPARVLLARIHVEQGRYPQAIAELKKALSEEPKNVDARFLLAVATEKSGRLDEALKLYEETQKLDPTNADVVMAITEVLVALQRSEEAQAYLAKHMDLAASDPGMYELAGRLALMHRQYDKAADCFQQASDLDRKNVRYSETLGQAQFLAGRLEEAADTFSKLVSNPDYPGSAMAYVMLGDCHMGLDNVHAAHQAYTRATNLKSDSALAWIGLAKACVASEQFLQAETAARRAKAIDGRSVEAAMLLGYALLKQGRSADAASLLSAALRENGDSSTLLCLLGRAYAAQGDTQRAIRCYNRALEVEPASRVARQLLDDAGAGESPKS